MEPIAPRELARRLEAGERLRIVDVREAEEFALGALPGSEHCPLSRWQEWLEDLAAAEEPLVLVCHHGVRSARVALLLEAQGRTAPTLNLTGGVELWAQEVDPSFPRY